MKKINTNLVETKNARNKDYKQILEKIIKDKVCPFCWENIEKYHTKPILERRNYWLITENFYPYENTNFSFKFI